MFLLLGLPRPDPVCSACPCVLPSLPSHSLWLAGRPSDRRRRCFGPKFSHSSKLYISAAFGSVVRHELLFAPIGPISSQASKLSGGVRSFMTFSSLSTPAPTAPSTIGENHNKRCSCSRERRTDADGGRALPSNPNHSTTGKGTPGRSHPLRNSIVNLKA